MGNEWSIQVEGKKKLVDSGLFKYIRHPLYTGLIIACLGCYISIFSVPFLLYVLVIIFPYLFFRAKIEEKLLIAVLPEYREYMKRTKMFIPKIF